MAVVRSCDRCGIILVGPHTKQVSFHRMHTNTLIEFVALRAFDENGGNCGDIHLCDNCLESLNKWFHYRKP